MGENIKILFDAYHLYHLPQFDPLIELLEKDSRFSVFYSTCSENESKEIEICSTILKNRPGRFIFHKDENIRKKMIRDLNLNVFICGWSRYDISAYVGRETIVGMIYHGIGIKPSYWRDNSERLDIRFVEGEYRMKQLKQYGITTELALTGFIKLDPLFNDSKLNTIKIKNDLGLDLSKKTVLFAPTFYPSSMESIGARLGEYTSDYNVILKPHLWTYFMDKFGDINLKPQRRIIDKLVEKYNHIKLLNADAYNILPYYKIADVLLTEASSTIYEMMSISKPVVINRFFNLKLTHRLFPSRLFKHRLDKEMNKDVEEVCFNVAKPQELPNILDQALKRGFIETEKIKNTQQKMLFKLDGLAAHRARDIILNKLNI